MASLCKRAAVSFVSFEILRGKSARADQNWSPCACQTFVLVPPLRGSQTWIGKTAKIKSTESQARVGSTICQYFCIVLLMIICIITEYSGIKNDTLSQIRVNAWILLPGYLIGKIFMSMVVARLAVSIAFTLIYIFTAEMFPTTLR